MPVSRDMLLNELKELQRLTAFEQTVATVRRAQAASTPVAQELAANAAKAGERLALLGQAVRTVGGAPDVVTPLLGRFGAFLQSQVNQVQTLQGALLGDLALEHQLRERARYARTLAVSLGEVSLLPVLDRLDGAHTETIDWLERRLAEVGRTGTSALRATPVQVAVGTVRRVYGAPFVLAAQGVNRVGGLVGRLTGRAAQALPTPGEAADAVSATAATVADAAQSAAGTAAQVAEDVVGTAADVAQDAVGTATSAAQEAAGTAADLAQDAAGTVQQAAGTAASTVTEAAGTVADTATSAADTAAGAVAEAADRTAQSVSDGATAAAQATEQVAEQVAEQAPETVVDLTDAASSPEAAERATHAVLEATGGDDVADAKPPFAGYERLTGDRVIRHVNDTEDVEELRVLLAFEQAHKARKGVLSAAQERLDRLVVSA